MGAQCSLIRMRNGRQIVAIQCCCPATDNHGGACLALVAGLLIVALFLVRDLFSEQRYFAT